MSATTLRTTDRRDVLGQGSEAQAVRTSHPPQPPDSIAEALQNRSARTALPDRVAMWIGLRLLLWGTRPVRGQATNSDLHQLHMERELHKRRAELELVQAWSGLHGHLPR
ncbi:hypothetical protein [Microbacterium sp. JZ31]|uniref:hypothetical protein n=1 Tax=Microbacterium sp. JZ31 TaxID=1906274 RepID=UPI00193472CE|nr:hypothetical protein [Microbacterium sp. JZ31]